jgi:hypothetical protein
MAQLDAIKPKSKDTASTIRTKADNILKTYRVQEVISLNILHFALI